MTEQRFDSLFALLKHLDQNGITGREKYRRVKRYIQFRARDQGIPVCGTFELTPLCNLSCKMCYVHLEREQMGSRDVLPAETWISIIDQAAEAGMMYAVVTGGECLTYSGFREVYLHLLSRGIEPELLTNGILLTENMVQFLDEHPPTGIQVTLYGPDEDEYERITGRRAFQNVMDNLARLKAHNLPFQIAVTPNAFMTKGKELIRLLHELEYPFLINSRLRVPRAETGRERCDAELDTYIDLYREDRRLGGEEDLLTVPDEDLPDPGISSGEADSKTEKGIYCGAGRSAFFMTWNGRMQPCNTFPGIGENVLETGFQTAWERINRQVKELLRPAECRECPYSKACSHCMVDHLDYMEPGHANPEVCRRIRRLVKEGFARL